MDELQDAINTLSAINTTVLLWIAIGLGSLFILFVVVDVMRRMRKRARSKRSGQTGIRAYSPLVYFKELRHMYRSLDAELARRRRHSERSRNHRNKWYKWF